MELREWALRVFTADSLEEKLLVPPGGLKSLTDHRPGAPVPWTRPPRPSHLQIAGKEERRRLPRPQALGNADMRARCLHVFANHELMALEMMAWALLAFPQAEPTFRKGLANILLDEQEHFLLYTERLQAMGVTFGDMPVNDHFWRVAGQISDPLDWVCTMHLTFEQSNLDHAPFYGKIFREVGDHAAADLMQTIFEDEIRHVRFGTKWLKHYQPEESTMFDTFVARTTQSLPPGRAMGPDYQTQARREAGLDENFVSRLRVWKPDV